MKPFFFFLCFLFLFGCEKATKYNSSPRDNFEALWRIMDENYCFYNSSQWIWQRDPSRIRKYERDNRYTKGDRTKSMGDI